MDQIIKTISQNLGLPEAAVRTGIGILLNFIKQKAADGGSTQFAALVNLLPGASDLMTSAPSGDGGGGLGGLLSKAGGLLGGNLGGAAELLGVLQNAGIPMNKAGDFVGNFLNEAKNVAGDDAVSAVLKNIPALSSVFSKE